MDLPTTSIPGLKLIADTGNCSLAMNFEAVAVFPALWLRGSEDAHRRVLVRGGGAQKHVSAGHRLGSGMCAGAHAGCVHLVFGNQPGMNREDPKVTTKAGRRCCELVYGTGNIPLCQ